MCLQTVSKPTDDIAMTLVSTDRQLSKVKL